MVNENMTPTEDTKGESGKDTDAMSGVPTEAEKTVTYTQDQLDKIIAQRLERERAKYEKERHDAEVQRAEQERISKLEGEERVKATYEAKLKKTAEERDEVLRQLRLTEARSELSSAGLDTALAERLVGQTLEETQANVHAIRQAVEAEATKMVNAQAAKGNPGNPTGTGSRTNPILDIMKRGAGLKSNKE